LIGDLFPETYPFEDINPVRWSWTKYYSNPGNFFIIPKYYNYINMEVLIAVFSGKNIDTSAANWVLIDHDEKEDYMHV